MIGGAFVIKQSSSNQEVAELVTNKQWPSDQLTALTYYVYGFFKNVISEHIDNLEASRKIPLAQKFPKMILELRIGQRFTVIRSFKG